MNSHAKSVHNFSGKPTYGLIVAVLFLVLKYFLLYVLLGFGLMINLHAFVFLSPLDNHAITFKEKGIWNYSTMLIREDLGLLVLGAREAVYALDINNISVAKSKVLF